MSAALPLESQAHVGTALANAAAQISEDEARALASRIFGIDGHARMLKGERDQNFRIDADSGAFLLKISHPAEDPAVAAFHTDALLHVQAKDPGLPLPAMRQTRDGAWQGEFRDADGMVRVIRMMGFLPGIMAAQVQKTAALRAAIGTALARFDRALSDFQHAADVYELSWDLTHAGKLAPLLGGVAEAVDRANAERALENFAAFVAPALPRLRAQVIHNDLNPYNVLVMPDDPGRITGLLDFGDMVRAPLVNDIAIAASYHAGRNDAVLAPMLDVVHAYDAIVPLAAAECDLLGDLIAARLAATILITEWRVKHHPDNREYILKNHPAASAGLAGLAALPRDAIQSAFRAACGLED